MTWVEIRGRIEAMEELEDGPLPFTIIRAKGLSYALESCDWPSPKVVTTRRSLGSDHDDGITLTWAVSDNTFRDITVWDERDT